MAHPVVLSYSLGVSILVEIAEKADVSVEGVVRVLTREPVSDAIKERVLDVLDDLSPEQTRAVQRFALAALHDVLPRPGEHPDVDPDQVVRELPVFSAAAPEQLPATGSDAALVQLSSVLGELAEAVRDLRRETDSERRERVDDLAVLIDLITTGWQGLDARLGRIERQVSRLEPGRREPPPAPLRVAPVAVEPAPIPAAPAAPAEVDEPVEDIVVPFEPASSPSSPSSRSSRRPLRPGDATGCRSWRRSHSSPPRSGRLRCSSSPRAGRISPISSRRVSRPRSRRAQGRRR